MIRVLIVEDSLTIRKRLAELLTEDATIEVVGEARDGSEAITMCASLRPDVITMDIVLPKVNGQEATEQIMAYTPTPIVIVSASFNRGELFRTFDALAAGALEVIDKPSGGDDDGWAARLRQVVKRAARVKVISHPRARLGMGGTARTAPSPMGMGAPGPASGAGSSLIATPPPIGPAMAPELEIDAAAAANYAFVALGASTGGPGAIARLLSSLPSTFPLPVLVVLHITGPFGVSFADWLDQQTHLPVRLVRDGHPLPPRGQPEVIVAPPGQHMVLKGARLRLTSGPERHSCRPSVDELFFSVAQEAGDQAIGCLLTGMGRDGAAGLLAIRQRGGMTIAQDEATSVVFGMPWEAARIGAPRHVLPLDGMAPFLARLASTTPSGRPQ